MIANAHYDTDAYLGVGGTNRLPAVTPRRELATFNKPKPQRASYDAAQDNPEYTNIWGNTDAYDADSAHSREVRHKLIKRSRYEVGSNGFSDGIAQTYATDLVGLGPQLRMQTTSEGFNRMVETEWFYWTKAVQLRRKLWCQAHAKHTDGEGFAVARKNKRIKHSIPLDYVLYEADQFQTPFLPWSEPGYIDGIKFDEFGNVEWYDLLRYHPGSSHYGSYFDLQPERLPAEMVFHWFKLRRPGQHRAVPECSSTLNMGAASRRFREATIAAAETAADYTTLLKTSMQPNELEAVSPMSTLDIQKRMLTALPEGWDAFQMKAEHPTATYSEFHKSLVNEQARPKSMPFNKAACDSSGSNYASGRLDHQTYYSYLDVDREDCNDQVLDPLFDLWFRLAVVRFGWLGGNPDAISAGARAHLWDWPKHSTIDITSEASANKTDLETGKESLSSLYAKDGRDYEDELAKDAVANGIDIDQQRQINMLRNMPQHLIPFAAQIIGLQAPSPTPTAAPTEATADV
jgi:capsid protein